MARRQRLTWRDRQASPPPATPGYDEAGREHPGSKPDPGAHQYENGDTSSWAEDPHPPPYPQSAPPATPGYGTSEMGDHPAAKKGSIKELVLERAAKAYRIASSMLGPKAHPDLLDDKALELMDLDDFVFDATYQRVAKDHEASDHEASDFMGCGPEPMGQFFFSQEEEEEGMEEEAMLAQMLEEDLLEEDVYEEPMDPMMEEGMDDLFAMFPKAAALKMGFDENGFAKKDEWKGDMQLFASLDSDGDGIVSIRELEASLYGAEDDKDDKKAAEDDEDKDDAEDKESKDDKKAAEDKESKDDKKSEDDEGDKEASFDLDFGQTGDPMGLSGTPVLSAEENAIFSEIFGGKTAADDEDEDEGDEGDEDEKDEKEGKKASLRTASQKPRPRKPGKGPKSLGHVTKTAKTGNDEVDELSKLWKSDPNIDGIF